jgi:deoxyribodipyrimidine photo-lyase
MEKTWFYDSPRTVVGRVRRGKAEDVVSVGSVTGSVVWFGRDLRLADHPALGAAVARGGPVIPVFILTPEEDSGGASRWWLHQSLTELAEALKKAGSRLTVRQGPAAEVLAAVARESGARTVLWNRRYAPVAAEAERAAERRLRAEGIEAESFPGNLLFEPGSILNDSGKPLQVFTAFWKACLTAKPPAEPAPAPKRIPAPAQWPDSLAITDLRLEPAIDWAGGLREAWEPGEAGAMRRWREFRRKGLADYSVERNRPDHRGTSRLSPHLHFGEISVRQVWHEAPAGGDYARQIAWREFSYHLLHHFPRMPREPLRPEFARFPWRMNAKALRAWTHGLTGYPMVDAGMRELWHTGWMHNRVRMLAASFLVKHLRVPWQEGAAWFLDTLVDADVANNTVGWQWTAGCGADAAPYFRIFNPVLQGKKFDPEGAYVKMWVPELGNLPGAWIHQPWAAPTLVLTEAGITLGKTYPRPIIDHEAARKRALEALATIKAR